VTLKSCAGAALAALGLAVAGVGRPAAQAPAASPAQSAAQAAGERVSFNYQIRPLLSDRCFRCHGPDEKARKAKMRLDTPEGAYRALDDGWFVIKPGDPSRSFLVEKIFEADADEMMPPPESHLTLSDDERRLLVRWIEQGAAYEPHWAFVPVPAAASLLPDAATGNPIDALVRARLAREQLGPQAPAEPAVLLRRLAFNLTGLPPTAAELDTFLADTAPGAYERAVARYLASPAYGERMAMDWLDLARYADTYGYQADVERDMSPWRDWVIRAFSRNLPYDRFLTWQLAGDLLPNATDEQRLATAFNRLHRQTNEGGSIEEEFRQEYVSDRVHTFGTAMLGLTLECARCHDHKFDPITQRDYYALGAFFNSIDESGLYSHFTNATPTPALPLWPADRREEHAAVEARIAALESRLAGIAREARPGFAAWRRTARVTRPAPVVHLDFAATPMPAAEGDKDRSPRLADRVAPTPAHLHDDPQPVTDVARLAGAHGVFQFSGDNAVVHHGAPVFRRTDSFSIAVRLRPTERQDRAVLLHQSRAWTDAGSRGYEIVLDHGRPVFALTHFWPGDAVAIRAAAPLPLDTWSTLVATYDGSSRAAGLRLYLDGSPLVTDTLRDRLTRDIDYRKAWNDNSAQPPLTIGARFRDSGFKNGLLDDVQLFDVALTAAEVRGTLRGAPGDVAFAHYVARAVPAQRQALAELHQLRVQENALVAGIPQIMVMEELPSPRPAHLLARGAYNAPKELVSRDTPRGLLPFPADASRDRLGLARWLTDRRHPLTARVAVNRIWRMHFGRGLVATQEDFGSQGRLPAHPELLDWLAATFMESGWDVKALHRLIVTSATFRQSSRGPAALTARDPENALLARGPSQRLLAEQIRDSALAASGLLTRRIGGRSVKPYQPAGLWEQAGTGKTYTADTGERLYRRSLYTFWRRTLPPPSMLTFDAVSREVCTARREVTTTPLQALVLLNDPQFVEATRVLAERLLVRFPGDVTARHRAAFRSLTGRTPDAREAALLAQLFTEQRAIFARAPASAEAFLSTGASAWNRTLRLADFAATTTVVSAIMNLDDFVVLR
jgi:hypothetical protein